MCRCSRGSLTDPGQRPVIKRTPVDLRFVSYTRDWLHESCCIRIRKGIIGRRQGLRGILSVDKGLLLLVVERRRLVRERHMSTSLLEVVALVFWH
jgi:hypothetical protein